MAVRDPPVTGPPLPVVRVPAGPSAKRRRRCRGSAGSAARAAALRSRSAGAGGARERSEAKPAAVAAGGGAVDRGKLQGGNGWLRGAGLRWPVRPPPVGLRARGERGGFPTMGICASRSYKRSRSSLRSYCTCGFSPPPPIIKQNLL